MICCRVTDLCIVGRTNSSPTIKTSENFSQLCGAVFSLLVKDVSPSKLASLLILRRSFQWCPSLVHVKCWKNAERSIEPKTRWKLVKSDANLKNQTVTSWVHFHLAKRQKLSSRNFNSKISARRQWISVTHSGSYKLDKSVLSNASRIVYYISAVTWYNKT